MANIRKNKISRNFALLPDIRSMGLMIMDPVWSQRFHKSGASELIHVIQGEVCVEMQNKKITGRSGDTLFIPSGTMHCDRFDTSSGLQVFMIFLNWPAEREFLEQISPAKLTALCKPITAELARQFDHLQNIRNCNLEADLLLARAHVHSVLLLILQTALHKKHAQRTNTMRDYGQRHRRNLMLRARQYLNAHYAEPISLEKIACALGVSPFYLSHVFSRENDFSLFACLTALRMQQARALLEAGRHNVAEAAYAVGYDNENYFSKVFRKHFGCAPRDIRK